MNDEGRKTDNEKTRSPLVVRPCFEMILDEVVGVVKALDARQTYSGKEFSSNH